MPSPGPDSSEVTTVYCDRSGFTGNNLLLAIQQQRPKDLCSMQFIEAMVWAGREDSLQTIARFITGRRVPEV